MPAQHDHVRHFRMTRAAIKIQRVARTMLRVQKPQKLRRQESSHGILGVVLASDAIRGGHIEEDRTGRVLKRISVHDKRRASHMGIAGNERLQSLLMVGEFDPSVFCSAEVADMMRSAHESDRMLELHTWADVADWNFTVDAGAIERRLAAMKPHPPKSNTKADARSRSRYLVQRPATAAGLGVRAARSLRRPYTAPAATRRRLPFELRAVFRVAIAAGRFARAASAEETVSFFITRGAMAAARNHVRPRVA